MNTKVEIDDLLKIVSPEMQDSFMLTPGNPIGRRALSMANAEYKLALDKVQKNSFIPKDGLWTFAIFCIVEVSLSIFVAGREIYGLMLALYLFGPMILFLIYAFVRMNLIQKKNRELVRDMKVYSEPLVAFREAVEGFGSLGGAVTHYDATTVERIAVTLAARILDAEDEFDSLRQAKERDIFGLMHLGKFILENQDKLEKALASAKLFSLEFKKSALYAQAREKMAEMGVLIAAKNQA